MESVTIALLTELAPLITGKILPYIFDKVFADLDSGANRAIDRVERNAAMARAYHEFLAKSREGQVP